MMASGELCIGCVEVVNLSLTSFAEINKRFSANGVVHH